MRGFGPEGFVTPETHSLVAHELHKSAMRVLATNGDAGNAIPMLHEEATPVHVFFETGIGAGGNSVAVVDGFHSDELGEEEDERTDWSGGAEGSMEEGRAVVPRVSAVQTYNAPGPVGNAPQGSRADGAVSPEAERQAIREGKNRAAATKANAKKRLLFSELEREERKVFVLDDRMQALVKENGMLRQRLAKIHGEGVGESSRAA